MTNILSRFYSAYRKFSKWLLIILSIPCFIFPAIVIIKAWADIPNFMLALKDEMVNNSSFREKLGPSVGYAIWFDKDLADKKVITPFSVTINGEHDSSYVKLLGKFRYVTNDSISYTKIDTIYKLSEAR